MLICPNCQFENLNNIKFCHECGASLTHKACHHCGTDVAWHDENCPHCGAFTGTLWWAIISEEIAPGQSKIFQLSRKHLDPRQRYQLKLIDRGEDRVQLNSSRQFFQGKVVDYQPLEKSLLLELLQQNAQLLARLQANLAKSDRQQQSFWPKLGVPALAVPYLSLHQFFPTVPEIHDAWLENGREVVLLPDRSEWKLFSQLWESEDLSSWQIYSWLDEMAELWQALSEVGCCQSLLVENNLRVDEEQNFSLQQLYLDPQDTKFTLNDLLQLWQLLFAKSSITQPNALSALLHRIEEDEIETVEKLRSQLEDLVSKQNFNCLSPSEEDLINTDDLSILQVDEPDSYWSQSDHESDDDLPTMILPMELLSLVDAGGTNIGRRRQCNEDYFGIQTEVKKRENSLIKKAEASGLYIVCDGMGGHEAGEVASAMAVETLQSYFQTHWQKDLPDKETIHQGILFANEKIYQENLKNSSSGTQRMGTTLVMVLVQNTKIAIAHVGDSRIYRVNRKSGLKQLSADHQVAQREIQEGTDPEVAYARPDAYQLTQALGPRDSEFVEPDIQFLELQEDTLLLLCSDGLSDNNLIETHWEGFLSPLISSRANVEQGLQKLIDFANERNGHDNITGIIVRIKVRPNSGHKLIQ